MIDFKFLEDQGVYYSSSYAPRVSSIVTTVWKAFTKHY